jgi:hypothetical protein
MANGQMFSKISQLATPSSKYFKEKKKYLMQKRYFSFENFLLTALVILILNFDKTAQILNYQRNCSRLVFMK